MFHPGSKIGQYMIHKKIGSGSFADVFQISDTNSKTVYAMKVINNDKIIAQPKVLELLNSEIKILSECKSENVVKLRENFKEKGIHCLVMEFCNGGDLCDYIDSCPNERISEEEALRFLKQLLNGFKELLKVGAIHRDFKLENVLIHKDNDDKVLKIADLGFSKQADMTQTTLGTRGYMAPEIMKFQNYDNKVDIWSLGIGVFRMLFGDFPFTGKNQYDLLQKMEKNEINFDMNGVKISKEFKDLIRNMLMPDPKKRINWEEIYTHPVMNPPAQALPVLRKLNSRNLSIANIQKEHEEIIFNRNKNQLREQSLKTSKDLKTTNSLEEKKSLPKEEENNKDGSELGKKSSSGSHSKYKKDIKQQENEEQENITKKETKKKLESDLDDLKRVNSDSDEEKNSDDQKTSKEKKKKSSFEISEKEKKKEQSSLLNSQYQENLEGSEMCIDSELLRLELVEVERKKMEIEDLEKRYLHLHNLISFHADVFDESYWFNKPNDRLLIFQLLMAKKIMDMALEICQLLETKNNVFKIDKKLFKEYTEDNKYQRSMEVFQERMEMYVTNYWDLKDNFAMAIMENEFYEKANNILDDNSKCDFNDLELLLKSVSLAMVEIDPQELNIDRHIWLIHAIKVLDLANYRQVFKSQEVDEYVNDLKRKSENELKENLQTNKEIIEGQIYLQKKIEE